MNLASSDIRSGVHGGSNVSSTSTFSTPGSAATASWMPSWIIGPAGQPIEVSEWMIFTFGPSICGFVEEADLDDVHAELRILHPVQRLDDVVLGDHGASLAVSQV